MTSELILFQSLTLPPQVRDGSAWYGAEMAAHEDWIEHFSEEEIEELRRAVQYLESRINEGSRIDVESMNAAYVLLSTIAPRLRVLLDEVLNGRGFVLIRSLPVERWTRRQAAIAFLAIGVHLGNL
ncbi:MAG TPA: hypothetical protein VFD62_19510, partial [Pyrinomonadaceae bacterium]|nr:hypothetical protein [Pyrinomonadaceae bacterium]